MGNVPRWEKRHPAAIANDEYRAKEARLSYDPRSMEAPEHQAEYLRNRLDAAFQAGWDACEKSRMVEAKAKRRTR